MTMLTALLLENLPARCSPLSCRTPCRRERGGKTQGAEQLGDPGVEEILRLVEAANARGIARRRRRLRRRLFVLLAAILAVCAVAAFRVSFGAGDKQESKEPGPSTVSGSATANVPAARSIPDFVWVAAKGAVRYRIEFVLGTRVVHTATTGVSRLHVARRELPPGRYRWRVWALDKSGARVGRALVDASVNIR